MPFVHHSCRLITTRTRHTGHAAPAPALAGRRLGRAQHIHAFRLWPCSFPDQERGGDCGRCCCGAAEQEAAVVGRRVGGVDGWGWGQGRGTTMSDAVPYDTYDGGAADDEVRRPVSALFVCMSNEGPYRNSPRNVAPNTIRTNPPKKAKQENKKLEEHWRRTVQQQVEIPFRSRTRLRCSTKIDRSMPCRLICSSVFFLKPPPPPSFQPFPSL